MSDSNVIRAGQEKEGLLKRYGKTEGSFAVQELTPTKEERV